MFRIMNMIKSVVAICLVLILMLGVGTSVYAAEIPAIFESIGANTAAEIVENIVGTDDINDVEKRNEGYIVSDNDIETVIPKDSSDFITMEGNGIEAIGMSLPEEVDTADGIATENGTIVYPGKGSVDVCVQSVTEEKDYIDITSVRETIIINDANAPREYTFDLDLPGGYSIVTSEDYYREFNVNINGENSEIKSEIGYLYITDMSGNIYSVVEPAWAKDAGGDGVGTHYTLKDNSIIQTVEFDENSTFPIIADPSYSHKTKKEYYSGNCSKVIKGYVSNQPTTGYSMLHGGSVYVVPREGSKVSVSVGLGAAFNAATISVTIGRAKSNSGEIMVDIPPGRKNYKVYASRTVLYRKYNFYQWYKPSGRNAKWQWKLMSRGITITDDFFHYDAVAKEV